MFCPGGSLLVRWTPDLSPRDVSPSMKQGLRITIYVDDAGDPTGESYLEALGPTANRLRGAGLRAVNEAVPFGVIHEALVAALDGDG